MCLFHHHAGLLAPSSDHDVPDNRHRSRSAAPAWSEGEGPRRSTESRSTRTPIQSPRVACAPSLENLIDADVRLPLPSAAGIKSAPVVTAPPQPFRSRTPDPDYARGVPLSRVISSGAFHFHTLIKCRIHTSRSFHCLRSLCRARLASPRYDIAHSRCSTPLLVSSHIRWSNFHLGPR